MELKVKKIRNAASGMGGFHSSYEYSPATYGIFAGDELVGQISGRWGGYMGGTTWELDATTTAYRRWRTAAPMFSTLRDAKAWLKKEGNPARLLAITAELKKLDEQDALEALLKAIAEGTKKAIEKAVKADAVL